MNNDLEKRLTSFDCSFLFIIIVILENYILLKMVLKVKVE